MDLYRQNDVVYHVGDKKVSLLKKLLKKKNPAIIRWFKFN